MNSKNLQASKQKNSKPTQNQEIEAQPRPIETINKVTQLSDLDSLSHSQKIKNLQGQLQNQKIIEEKTSNSGIVSTVVSENETHKNLETVTENFTQVDSVQKSRTSQIETRMPSLSEKKLCKSVINEPKLEKKENENKIFKSAQKNREKTNQIIKESKAKPEVSKSKNKSQKIEKDNPKFLSPNGRLENIKSPKKNDMIQQKSMSEPRSKKNTILPKENSEKKIPMNEKKISSTHAVLNDPITESKKLTTSKKKFKTGILEESKPRNEMEDSTKKTNLATRCESDNTPFVPTQIELSNIQKKENQSAILGKIEGNVSIFDKNIKGIQSQLVTKSESRTRSKIRANIDLGKERNNLKNLRGMKSKDIKKRLFKKSKSDSKRVLKKRKLIRSKRKKKPIV